MTLPTLLAPILVYLLAIAVIQFPLTAAGNGNACIVCNCSSSISDVMVVDCKKKNLSKIPTEIPENVTLLDLNGNLISDLQGLEGFASLKTLSLIGNKLSKWQDSWLNGTSALTRLHLSQNSLTNLPGEVCNIAPQLSELLLDSNNLQNAKFDAKFLNCTKLIKLGLAINNYNEITNETFSGLANSQLKSLRLTRTQFDTAQSNSLKWFAKTLTSLDLSVNPKLSESLLSDLINASRLNLTSLILRGSNLKRLPTLPFAHKLQVLTLENSKQLTEVTSSAIAQLPKLNTLSLKDTGVASWQSDTFASANDLMSLDLRGTPLTTIGGIDGRVNPLPQLASNVSHLRSIKLSGANISCDCNLYWLIQQVHQHRNRFVDIKSTKCQQPAAESNVTLLNFDPGSCSNQSTTQQPITTTSTPSDNSKSKMTMTTIIVISASAMGVVIAAAIATFVAVRCFRRPPAPRIVLDNDCDPLVSTGSRSSIWIRLRSLLRQRQPERQRPPIFEPEDYLSEDA